MASPSGRMSLADAALTVTLLQKPMRSLRGQRKDLWLEAAALISQDDRNELDFKVSQPEKVPDQVLTAVTHRIDESRRKQWKIRRRDGRQIVLRDVLERIARCVDRFKSLGDLMVSVDPVHAALPWACVRFFLEVAIYDIEKYGTIIEGIEVVSRAITRYAELEKNYLRGNSVLKTQLTEGVIKLYAASLTYLAEARRFYGTSTRRRLVHSVTQVSRSRIDECLDNVVVAEETAFKLATLVQGEEQNNGLLAIQGSIRSLQERLLSDPDLASEQRRRVLQGLRSVSTKLEFENNLTLCEKGTATWLFKRQIFEDWLTPHPKQPKLCWVHGPPGFGKSVLSASAIEYLRSLHKPVSYFFCIAEDSEKREPLAILSSWIAQMVEQSDEAAHIAASDKSEHGEMAVSTRWTLFKKLCMAVRSWVFLIDGFDECSRTNTAVRFHSDDGRERFLQEMIRHAEGTSVQILIMSRESADIKSEILKSPNIGRDVIVSHYEITEKDTRPDIEILVNNMVSSNLSKRPSAFRQELAKDIVEKSAGQILRLPLLKRKLRPTATTNGLKRIVSQMPAELGQVYERELKRLADLDEDERDLAIEILRWVLFADRPLKIRELVEAMIVRDSLRCGTYPADEFPEDWKEVFVDDAYVNDMLRALLGSVLRLKSSDEAEHLSAYTVHFVHASFREYLLEHAGSTQVGPTAIIFSDPPTEQMYLADFCLRYLCLDVFADHRALSTVEGLRGYPFFDYAYKGWQGYGTVEDGEVHRELWPLVDRLFDPEKGNFRTWAEARHSDHKKQLLRRPIIVKAIAIGATLPNMNDNPGSQLYYASSYGVVELTKKYHSLGMDINNSGGVYGTPLGGATVSGRLEAVKYLVENGASVSQRGGFYDYAIVAAAARNRTDLVQLLVDNAAPVDVADVFGFTPVYHTCLNANARALKILVDKGPDLNVLTQGNWSPLGAAAWSGSHEMVQVLLDAGADPNLQLGLDKFTALHMAAQKGSTGILQSLMRHGADPAIVDRALETPLFWAVNYAQLTSVETLLRCGSPIDTKSYWGHTPLLWAVIQGDEKAASLLLSFGADPSCKDRDGDGAFDLAIGYHNNTMLSFLLKIEAIRTSQVAGVESNDKEYQSLLAATVQGNEDRIGEGAAEKELLGRQSVLDSLLLIAVAAGSLRMVRFWIGKGASAGTTNPSQRNAIDYAVVRGDVETFQFLVKHEVGFRIRDHSGKHHLYSAAGFGKLELTGLILQHYTPHDYGMHLAPSASLIETWKRLCGKFVGVYTWRTFMSLTGGLGKTVLFYPWCEDAEDTANKPPFLTGENVVGKLFGEDGIVFVSVAADRTTGCTYVGRLDSKTSTIEVEICRSPENVYGTLSLKQEKS